MAARAGVAPGREFEFGPAFEAFAREVAFWTFTAAALAMMGAALLSGPYAAARRAERRLLHARMVNLHHARVNDRLRREIDAVKNDPFYAERVVRVDLAWRRPGERVLRLPGEPPATGTEPLPGMPPPAGWLERTAGGLAAHPRRRAFAFGAAVLLILVAFGCFSNRREPAPA